MDAHVGQSASSSSETMRANAVPTCWPISARITLTVTMPALSIWYQMVGSKSPDCTAAAGLSTPNASRENAKTRPVEPAR